MTAHIYILKNTNSSKYAVLINRVDDDKWDCFDFVVATRLFDYVDVTLIPPNEDYNLIETMDIEHIPVDHSDRHKFYIDLIKEHFPEECI